MCLKKFSLLCNLRSHQRTHHQDQPLDFSSSCSNSLVMEEDDEDDMIDIEWYLIMRSDVILSHAWTTNSVVCINVCFSLFSRLSARRIKTKTHAHGSWFNLLTLREEEEGRQCQRLLSFQMMLFDIDLFICSKANVGRRTNFQGKHRSMFKQTKHGESFSLPRWTCPDCVISTVDGHSRVCGNEVDFYSRGEITQLDVAERREKSLCIVHSRSLSLQNDPKGVNQPENVKSKDGEEQVDAHLVVATVLMKVNG